MNLPKFQIPDELLIRFVTSCIIIVVTYIISLFIRLSIDTIFSKVKSRVSDGLLARTRTIKSLLKNIIDISLFIIAILIVLSQWDINIVPLLTGAGLAGLAISFGAQTLIKDVISGFFIIFEDQYSVGDRIKVADVEGTVEHITLRLTVLRDKKENLIYIPNSQITKVMRYI